MKPAENYIYKKTRNLGVIVPVGERSLDFHGMITLNETGAFLWEKLSSGAEREELINAITDKYDVDKSTAKADVDEFLTGLREAGIIDE